MQANYVQRLRVTFSKTGPTRFIGHLDVARTWERALNRAKIPVAYTQGFNQRPRMQFATATPLGYTSECEIMDIWLREAVEPEVARDQMMARMAPGIEVLEAADVPLKGAALQMLTRETTYVAQIPTDLIEYRVLAKAVDGLLTADTLPRERVIKRKTKRYDLRPLILDLALSEDRTAASHHQLTMRLVLEPSNTGRPDEVLSALGLDPLDIRIHRAAIVLADEAAVTDWVEGFDAADAAHEAREA